MSNEATKNKFISAFMGGEICLHPTDTLPGLTANPLDVVAIEKLQALKIRDKSKPLIGLTSSLEQAQNYWQPLPEGWLKTLSNLWPGSLSVIWKASELAPACMMSSDQTICLRVPNLGEESKWLNEALSELSSPLPTTSVNISGEGPKEIWSDAERFALKHGVFTPKIGSALEAVDLKKKPSTIIKLRENSSFEILRQGSISGEQIRTKIFQSNSSGK